MRTALFIVFLSLCGLTHAQNDWMTLSRVRYTTEFDPEMGIEKTIPTFSSAVIQLSGKEITLKGYLVPLEGKKAHSHFMFSAFPYSSCFFCGAAGPETIIEVYMKDDQQVSYTDEQITLTGTFTPSQVNEQGIFYTLTNANIK